MGRLPELGLGARLLLIILLAVVVPLSLAGVWLTRDAGHAGETLLQQRMEGALAELAREVSSRWVQSRSSLLDLGESPAVLELLRGPIVSERALEPGPWSVLAHEVVIRDRNGRAVARSAPDDRTSGGGLPIRVPLYAPGSGELVGALDARLVVPEALLPQAPEWTARTGGVLGILEPDGELSVLPTPFDPHLLASPRFVLAGEEWVTVRRSLVEPPATLVLAAPVEPFAEPFRRAARRGILLLLAVAVAGFGTAAFLTHQATRPVEGLVDASAAVARGELDRRVDVSGPREVRHLARAFNAMAAELQRTLDALAKQEALAAVGEFASALAHELRNPLTAIRVDLQRVEEVSDDGERRRVLTDRMLAAVRRLDRTVSGVLRVAGSGRLRLEALPVETPLATAIELARPLLDRRSARLEFPELAGEGTRVVGDAAALEQLFLNLLLNAAEALEGEGPRRVEVEVLPVGTRVGVGENKGTPTGGLVEVRIRDTGRGIPPEALDRVFEPLYSTKSGGTGLGLVIANRIARAHGGTVALESRPGQGTTVTVRLPGAGSNGTDRSVG